MVLEGRGLETDARGRRGGGGKEGKEGGGRPTKSRFREKKDLAGDGERFNRGGERAFRRHRQTEGPIRGSKKKKGRVWKPGEKSGGLISRCIVVVSDGILRWPE